MINIFTCLLITNSLQLIAAEDWVPGWCEDAEGKDQNAGVIEKANLNKEECLRACRNHQGATGCEFRVGQCSIHTRNVGGGNGNTGYSCMVFLNKVEYLLSQTIGAATIARYGTTSAGGPQCLQCLQDHAPRCISKYCGTKSGVVCAQCLYIENADICRAPCGVDYSQSLPIQRLLEDTKGNCRTAYFVCEDEASTKPPQGCRSICNVPLRFDTLGSTLGLETAAGLPIKGCKVVYFHCTNFYLNFYSKPLPFSETCMTCCKDFFPVEQRGKPHSCNREQIRG